MADIIGFFRRLFGVRKPEPEEPKREVTGEKVEEEKEEPPEEEKVEEKTEGRSE